MQNNLGKWATLGSILILLGTSIGAGILALPMASAELNFSTSCLVLIAAWLIMTATGLFMLEVNVTLPAHRNHFDSMAGLTLGLAGRIVAWVASICLFYSLLAAYISGNAALFVRALNLAGFSVPAWVSAVVFVALVAAIVFFSTRGVDLLNRGLMSFKGLALIIVFAGLLPHVNLHNLHVGSFAITGGFATVMAAAPVFLVGFGYHAVLPSLVNYLGPDIKRLRFIIWTGTSAAFIIYILWLAISFGVLPGAGAFSLHILHEHGSKVAEFLSDIETVVPTAWVHWAVDAFSDVAMATSCLGVALGMFDFLADAFKRGNDVSGRVQSLFLTLVPPFVVAIALPNFFLLGLNFGAIFLVVLEIFLPVLVVWRFRSLALSSGATYTVSGGKWLLGLVFAGGLAFLLADLVSRF